MHRLVCISGCLCLLALGCDKPVPDEIVKANYGGAPSSGSSFADGSVIRDELDAGLDASTDDQGDEPDEDVPFSKAALLKAAADCALDHLKTLRSACEQLRDESARWAKDGSAESASAARAAFRSALSEFQVLEALKFGPAARSSSIGGKNLGDKLYTAYPSLDRCAIDRQLARASYSAVDIASSPSRQRGLGAFEYLAYYVGRDNGCQAANDINVDGSWAALSAEELAQRRADFAAAVAVDTLSVVDDILTAWGPKGDNFYQELTHPGGKLFRDEQNALNAISNAIFYVEIDVKDLKLGRLLNRGGMVCQANVCPETLESPLSGLSSQNLVDDLAGFRDVFQGCGRDNRGLGFDDWLLAVGATETREDMLAALDAAEAAVAAVRPIEQTLSSDRARVMAAYDAVKGLTDRLKSEFVSALGVEPPAGLEGDND